MKRWLFAALCAVALPASALEPLEPPAALPTNVARPLLEQDPAVRAARAGMDVALHDAGLLERSTYEWTTRASTQRRRVQDAASYQEWNVAVERTFRLPAKTAADRELANATLEESEARYGEALHEAARELLDLWLDWLAAEHGVQLADSNVATAEAGFGSVEKRFRAGDASRLDLSVARADLAEQKRLSNDAKTQASAAWARLSSRFPAMHRQISSLPAPVAAIEDDASWRERILAESDELRIARMQVRKAQASADRARAERIPDPTFGVYTGSEVGGRERIAGITVTIPLPGSARETRAARALSLVDVARRELEVKTRRLESEIARALAVLRGSRDTLKFAREGAAAMQENALLTQRAYDLGEADLQTVLLARRQATAARVNALSAETATIKASYGLVIDAHLIWDLAND